MGSTTLYIDDKKTFQIFHERPRLEVRVALHKEIEKIPKAGRQVKAYELMKLYPHLDESAAMIQGLRDNIFSEEDAMQLSEQNFFTQEEITKSNESIVNMFKIVTKPPAKKEERELYETEYNSDFWMNQNFDDLEKAINSFRGAFRIGKQ